MKLIPLLTLKLVTIFFFSSFLPIHSFTSISTSHHVSAIHKRSTTYSAYRRIDHHPFMNQGAITQIKPLFMNQGEKENHGNIDNFDEEITPQSEDENNRTNNNEPVFFESLDIVLNKARKRPMIMLLPYKIQAIFNKPIITLSLPTVSVPSVITIGDLLLALIALKLDSVGFAFGYIFGKLTTQYLRENEILPIALIELWTVILAVGLDVVWKNVD